MPRTVTSRARGVCSSSCSPWSPGWSSGVGDPRIGTLSTVQKNDQSASLPASAESTKAREAARFQEQSTLPYFVVVTRETGLTPQDQAAVGRYVAAVPGLTLPGAPGMTVQPAGPSSRSSAHNDARSVPSKNAMAPAQASPELACASARRGVSMAARSLLVRGSGGWSTARAGLSSLVGMGGFVRLLVAMVVGASLGLVNSLANVVGGPYAPHPLRPDGVWGLQLLGAVLGTTWAWSAVAFLCGLCAARRWQAPLLAVAGMWCADLAYYSSDWIGGVSDGFSLPEVELWAVLGLGAGLGMGLLAGLTRVRAAWSILPGLAAFALVWQMRQASGADVVADASYRTQTILTVMGLVALLIWWGRRQHAGPCTRTGRRGPRSSHH